MPFSFAASTMARASGCSLAVSTLAASRSISSASKSVAGTIAVTAGLPSVSVPVLSITRVSTFSIRSSACGVADQDAGLRAAPDADHDRHRRRKPERAGAGDDQHRDRRDEAIGEARLRPEHRPGGKGDHRRRDHQRHEPAGDLIGEPLDRRARALRLRHHLHDLREQRVAADLVGAHDEGAALVDRAGDHVRALLLRHRHGFAGDQRLVDRRAALQHLAVDRHLVAGPHAQAVADLDLVERNFFVAAIGIHATRGLGREIEQRPDRARGRLARAQFQHLAEQHQYGDDRRGFEIDRDRSVMAAEGGGKIDGAKVATTL